jgi:hypothetical protein
MPTKLRNNMKLSELNNITLEQANEIAKNNFKNNHTDEKGNNYSSQEDKHIIYTSHGLGAYGISVDEEDIDSLEVASWVKEIGILMDYEPLEEASAMNQTTHVSEFVLDALISYKLAKKKAILEIPFEKIYQLKKHDSVTNEDYISFTLDKRYELVSLLGLVANMSLNISFLPPKEVYDTLENDNSVSDEVKEKIAQKSFSLYKEVLNEALLGFLEKENFENFVFPITNYIEYLYSQIIYKTEEFIVTDSYILNFFASYLSDTEINDLKDEIRENLYKYYGSKEEFENIAKILMNSIYETMKEVSIENRDRLLEQKATQQ